ncbi:AI-2E family transporter [Amnibacterium soli]|uniref:AI-2E family transporter n=1 Tax=Amnibacterium soli TaxID=1282736 RepID=A0ABP8ZGU0_9MICO
MAAGMRDEPPRGRTPVLPRATIVLLGAAGVAVTAAGLRAVSGIVGPLLLALVLVITVSPLERALRRRVPAWLSLTVMLVVVYGVLLVFAVALTVSAARLAGLLVGYGPEFQRLAADGADWLTGLGVTQDQIDSVTGQLDLARLAGLARSVLDGAGGALSALVLLLSVLFFLVLDAAAFPRLLRAAEPQRPHLVEALRDFAENTRRWLLVSAGFGVVLAVLDAVVLLVVGVPLPWLWALLAFLANFIPSIGFVVALVPPALLALLTGGPVQALWVVVLFALISTVVQTFIAPRVVGGAVGLSGTLTFLSVLLWGVVLGPLGALLAVPLSLLAKALLVDADPGLHWLRPVLSGTPQEEDE